MNKVAISALKQMRVEEMKALLPFEVTADGIVIGRMSKFGKVNIRMKCPNCKFVNEMEEPDHSPGFLSGIRIKNREVNYDD